MRNLQDERDLPAGRPAVRREHLLAEIREDTPRRFGWRPRLAFVAAGALALGAATVAVPVLTDDTSNPAYAVTSSGGDVEVKVFELRDADGLERRLAEEGIKADVTFHPWGKRCKQPRYEKAGTSPFRDHTDTTTDVEIAFWIDQAAAKGGTVVIEASRHDDADLPLSSWRVPGFTTGPVQPCELIDDPVVSNSKQTRTTMPKRMPSGSSS